MSKIGDGDESLFAVVEVDHPQDLVFDHQRHAQEKIVLEPGVPFAFEILGLSEIRFEDIPHLGQRVVHHPRFLEAQGELLIPGHRDTAAGDGLLGC